MKKAKIIRLKLVSYTMSLGILVLGMMFVLSISPLASTSYAFNSSHGYGWASAISHLAEQEIKEKEQITNAENKNNEIVKTANTKVDTNENQNELPRECLTVMVDGAKEC